MQLVKHKQEQPIRLLTSVVYCDIKSNQLDWLTTIDKDNISANFKYLTQSLLCMHDITLNYTVNKCNNYPNTEK